MNSLRKLSWSPVFSLTILLGAFLPTGCSESNRTEVTGKVTLGGKPITGGTIKVANEDGTITDSAPISGDGSFTLTKAPLGMVSVAIDPPQPRGEQALPRGGPSPPLPTDAQTDELTPEEQQAIQVLSRLPASYRDLTKTPIKVTIEKGGTEIPVELKTGGS